MQYNNLFGKKFGMLEVIGYLADQGDPVPQLSSLRWLCKCNCGNYTIPKAYTLMNDMISSCGCIASKRRNWDDYDWIFGRKFGKLEILGFCAIQDLRTRPGSWKWLAICECVRHTTTSARAVKQGYTSCGICVNSGENSPNWKGGRSRENPRNHRWVKDWRAAVFKRDNWICQACGAKGGMAAHHLYSWSEHPQKRILISNGITLCKSCHKEFHYWNGGYRIDCTPRDYMNWVIETRFLA